MDLILIIIGLLITATAQIFVSSSYSKYNKINAKGNLTGFEVARTILDKHGLNNVYVTETSGYLSDHYDSSRKVIRLSKDIFHGTSIASCSVAAHEVGHAIQDKEGYSFLRLRNSIIPIVNFSSYAGYLAIFFGLMFNSSSIAWIGIALEFVILFFQLITLPVEFDASKRALAELQSENMLDKKEIKGSKTMLKAAAYTYVASLVTAVLEILRLILIFGRSNDN